MAETGCLHATSYMMFCCCALPDGTFQSHSRNESVRAALSCGSPGYPSRRSCSPDVGAWRKFPPDNVSRLLPCSQGGGDGQGTMKTIGVHEETASMTERTP